MTASDATTWPTLIIGVALCGFAVAAVLLGAALLIRKVRGK